ncbi:glycosyltransferase [Daejeonella sp.]|uniref:glycosyltransferase n=1 Tax=Daejeonella sp. TaxID=2805397 RepID=UPI0030C049F4
MSKYFKDVTLLITHYNRSSSLNRLLETLKDQKCTFEDIVVSDDGSDKFHLKSISDHQSVFGFRLITSSINKGLANNINKGQSAVQTPYTLYIQEDFIPEKTFASHLENAVDIMRARPELDIVRFYAYRKYPYLIPYRNGFSEMVIKPWHWDFFKVHFYSDHPHLRRSDFLKKFGQYREGIKSDRAEYRMCLSFIQRKGKGLFFNNFQSLFSQRNSELEPSTVPRGSWTQTKNPLINAMKYVYRQVKYNYDIHFFKIR